MEKTLHDVHRERVKKWKDEYPAHLMSIDELREYRTLMCKSDWNLEDSVRAGVLRDKYIKVRAHYKGRDEKYFEITKPLI